MTKQTENIKKKFDVSVLLIEFQNAINDKKEKIRFLKDEATITDIKKHLGQLKKILIKKSGESDETKFTEDQQEDPKDYTPKELKDIGSFEAHDAGKALWKCLLSAALRDIDPTAKGNSKIFEYLDESAKFEDLLYGLEPYYRDHTLHSLWVYLMGVILTKKGGTLENFTNPENLNWYLFNDIEVSGEENANRKGFVGWSKLRSEYFAKQLQEHKHATWCIIALCHDLGYSLAKLKNLNERVESVLKYYDIPNFNRTGYTLDIEHQYLTTQFLDLMAMDIRIVPGDGYGDLDNDTLVEKYTKYSPDNNKETVELAIKRILNLLNNENSHKSFIDKAEARAQFPQSVIKSWLKEKSIESNDKNTATNLLNDMETEFIVKCYRDDSTYWRLCKALEQKEHGILSAYLIYKTLGIFADTSIRGAAEEWGLDDEEVIGNVIRGDILFAIAQHEFSYKHVNQLGSYAELLIICDELEEFTRLGRELQSRQYHATTSTTSLTVENSRKDYKKSENVKITIEYIYQIPNGASLSGNQKSNPEYMEKRNVEYKEFVNRKIGLMCKIFSLNRELDKNEVTYNKISEVVVKIKCNKNVFKTYIFEMKVDDNENFAERK